MSPVVRVGARCTRCRTRPEWADALCNPCWRLLCAFGHRHVDPVCGQDRPQPALEILHADSLEFERGLAAWLSGIDPLSPDFR
jgi:hypothetical protein